MTTIIDEQNLRFVFDDQWQVIKYDDHRDYRERIGHLQGTKALDFVAVHRDQQLYLIEVKDFRGHRIENIDRLKQQGDRAVSREVGQKVRETIAGIVAAQHRGSEENWGPSLKRLTSRNPPVQVLLWLEQDLPPGPPGRRANQASVLIDSLKQRLGWLTPRVMVLSLNVGNVPDGLAVTNLPGAGR